MQSSRNRILFLLQRFSTDTATPAEEQELFRWMAEAPDDDLLKQHVMAIWNEGHDEAAFAAVDWENIFQRSLQEGKMRERQPAPVRRIRTWHKIAAVAAMVALVITLALLLNKPQQPAPVVDHNDHNPAPLHDALPGSDKAVLILADGSTVLLDSTGANTRLVQGSAQIVQAGGKGLQYQVQNGQAKAVYNTLKTPRGGQYRVTLSDGTRVWLNAATTLTYPSVFTGSQRRVQLDGEAYFEVAAQAAAGSEKKRSFIVEARGTQVEVLGTHFNIMAYSNEHTVNTTLIEGAVEVSNAAQTRRLTPGQQARLSSNGRMHIVEEADVELAVAWKNGYTAFRNADIRSIMRQVERWYDVQVAYQGEVPERSFSGEISRSANLSELLRILTASDIHFNIEGKKMVVKP